jgi:hypothetical protein
MKSAKILAIGIRTMLDIRNPILWLFVVLVLGLLVVFMPGRFSAEKRERRRRDRSHKPVVSRKHGPTVRLAVDVDQPKNDGKR